MIKLPIMRLSTTHSTKKKISLLPILLKKNKEIDLVINTKFDKKVIKYDKGYNANQFHSKYFKKHLKQILNFIDKRFNKDTKIIEIGCGKGDFFELLQKNYKNSVGYDPSYEGSNPNIFKKILKKKDRLDVDLIILRHVLEHIQHPFEFLSFLKKNSPVDTKILIEVPDYCWIDKKKAFWDIMYDHVNYFSYKSFKKLFKKNRIIKYVFNKQYLLILAKLDELNINFSQSYSKGKWDTIDYYRKFNNIEKKINTILNKATNNIYVWGANTKGLIFLYHCFLKKKLIDKVPFLIDIDPAKQGKYIIPINKFIASPSQLIKKLNEKDIILVVNSNYLSEIKDYIMGKTNIIVKIKTL